jgi:UDP-N-acetylmuramate dehydrogenase
MTEPRQFIEILNAETGFTGTFRYDEPMAAHTTFKVGGPADVWVRPEGDTFPEYAAVLLKAARSAGVPVFIAGGGANLVVADKGIRGIVLDTGGWTGWNHAQGTAVPGSVTVRSGTPVDVLVDALAEQGRGGLEFLAGMPGTVGGAVWMNARCYEQSISDILMETEILDESLKRVWLPFEAGDFSYKRSPFQKRDVLILSARFRTEARDRSGIRGEMAEHRRDREGKGQYRFPSAGSAFKNNREFGKPTGQIIDELGLRGLAIGGAAVAEWHGNIIINRGNASASDIKALTDELVRRTGEALGIGLEPEIRFVGEW